MWPAVRTSDLLLSVMEEPQILGKKYFLSEPQKWIEYHKRESWTPLHHQTLQRRQRIEPDPVSTAAAEQDSWWLGMPSKDALAILGLTSLSRGNL